jgi:hypothetical protein
MAGDKGFDGVEAGSRHASLTPGPGGVTDPAGLLLQGIKALPLSDLDKAIALANLLRFLRDITPRSAR